MGTTQEERSHSQSHSPMRTFDPALGTRRTLLIYSLALATLPFLPSEAARRACESDIRAACAHLQIPLPEAPLLEHSVDPCSGCLQRWEDIWKRGPVRSVPLPPSYCWHKHQVEQQQQQW